MKLAIRSVLLASVLGLLVTTTAIGAEKVHDAGVTCATDTTGATSCFEWEAAIRSTNGNGGMKNVKMDGESHSSTVDATGAVIAAYDQSIHQKSLVVETADGPMFKKLDLRTVEQITESGATRCVVSTIVMRNGVEKVNEVVTTDGAC